VGQFGYLPGKTNNVESLRHVSLHGRVSPGDYSIILFELSLETSGPIQVSRRLSATTPTLLLVLLRTARLR